LRDRSRAADFSDKKHFHTKIAALVSHLQHVSNADLARWLGRLLVAKDSAEAARSRRHGAGLEKSGRP
jgi:hypothetical protein